jgi:two-component system CheB/CheR fusion protein
MPNATIATGAADLVVAAEAITSALRKTFLLPELSDAAASSPFQEITELLKSQTGLDVSRYKVSTIDRRMHRRMALYNVSRLDEYLAYLKDNDDEVLQLSRDLLITVTQFFRDSESFHALKAILEKRLAEFDGESFRVWVPGCASGEEAYSIAILIEEYNRHAEIPVRYQVFATDLDLVNTNRGRQGIYSDAAMEGVPAELRTRYFLQESEHSWEVTRTLRERVLFAQHNLIDNPPFGRLDLISCRNLLIYFMSDLQSRVFKIFHYALNSNGLLFLGKSENVQQAENLFNIEDKTHRIFVRNDSLASSIQQSSTRELPKVKETQTSRIIAPRSIESDKTFQQFLPALVMVRPDDSIEFVSELGREFLNIPTGKFNNGFFSLVTPEYRADVRAMMHKVRRTGEAVSSRFTASAKTHGQESIEITVIPDDQSNSVFVVFRPMSEVTHHQTKPLTNPDLVNELEYELSSTREHLQTVVEELETSNEELQSVNEEMQSSNEELQSTNEELQTSNEELQSTNEELLTVNDELHVKTLELESTLTDLENIQNSLESPLVLVDSNLIITRYTGALVGIAETKTLTIGQKLFSVVWHFDIQSVYPKIQAALEQAENSEVSIEIERRELVLKISPYKTKQNVVKGAVLLFLDVSEINSANRQIADSQKFLQEALNQQQDAILLVDSDFATVYRNRLAAELFQNNKAFDAWLALFSEESQQSLQQILSELATESSSGALSCQVKTRSAETIFHAAVTKFTPHKMGPSKYSLSFRDVTELAVANLRLRNEMELAIATVNGLEEGVITCDRAGQIRLVNHTAAHLLGEAANQLLGKSVTDLMPLKDQDGNDVIQEALRNEGRYGPYLNVPLSSGAQGRARLQCDVTVTSIEAHVQDDIRIVIGLRDSSARDEVVQELQYRANNDGLTGLYSRAYFDSMLVHYMNLNQQNPSTALGNMALLYLDLDQFKAVNDTCGHHAGDNLLRQVAALLQSLNNPQDTLARLGGDEFGLILVGVDEDSVKAKAARIVASIEEFRFSHLDKIFRIGVSIGIVFLTSEIQTASEALSLADAACYRAKEDGRHCYHLHQSNLDVTLTQQEQLSTAMHIAEAIEQGDIQLNAQEIRYVRQRSGAREIHFEVLSRLESDGLLLQPSQFIPAAERYGKIHLIDQHVLSSVLNHEDLLDFAGYIPVMSVSINISALSLTREDFLRYAVNAIERSQLDPSKVILEMTETGAINHIGQILRAMQKLKSLGVRFSLDDFGTGMSSFALLKRLPIDFVKIDGSFVKDITSDFVDAAMVEAVVKVAHEMNILTIAEYAHDAEVLGALKALGVDAIQGHHYGAPVPLTEFLANHRQKFPE